MYLCNEIDLGVPLWGETSMLEESLLQVFNDIDLSVIIRWFNKISQKYEVNDLDF